MNNIKIGKLMQSHGLAHPKKYKIFLTDSLEELKNKTLLGEADTFEEAYAVIKAGLQNFNLELEPCHRYLLADDATYMDFGSWSKFIAIVPPFSREEITGKS